MTALLEEIALEVSLYETQIAGLLRDHAPPGCRLAFEPDLKQWQAQFDLKDDDDFRAGVSGIAGPGNYPLIVLLNPLTYEARRSAIDYVESHGFPHQAAQLEKPLLFLEHLVLHECAHLLPGELLEYDCDLWAFERLRGVIVEVAR